MAELILMLVPLAVAAALQPADVIAMGILLQTRRGAAKGFAFLAGMITFRLLLGGIFWVLTSKVEETIETTGGEFSIFVGAVLVVLGLLMLIYALRRVLSPYTEDQAAASWLVKLNKISLLQTAFIGFVLLALDPKDWLVDISAVDLVSNADLTGRDSLLAYLSYILMAQSLLLIPLFITVVFPQKAQGYLSVFNAWIKRHERVIEITVAVIFGLLFMYIGLEQINIQ